MSPSRQLTFDDMIMDIISDNIDARIVSIGNSLAKAIQKQYEDSTYTLENKFNDAGRKLLTLEGTADNLAENSLVLTNLGTAIFQTLDTPSEENGRLSIGTLNKSAINGGRLKISATFWPFRELDIGEEKGRTRTLGMEHYVNFYVGEHFGGFTDTISKLVINPPKRGEDIHRTRSGERYSSIEEVKHEEDKFFKPQYRKIKYMERKGTQYYYWRMIEYGASAVSGLKVVISPAFGNKKIALMLPEEKIMPWDTIIEPKDIPPHNFIGEEEAELLYKLRSWREKGKQVSMEKAYTYKGRRGHGTKVSIKLGKITL